MASINKTPVNETMEISYFDCSKISSLIEQFGINLSSLISVNNAEKKAIIAKFSAIIDGIQIDPFYKHIEVESKLESKPELKDHDDDSKSTNNEINTNISIINNISDQLFENIKQSSSIRPSDKYELKRKLISLLELIKILRTDEERQELVKEAEIQYIAQITNIGDYVLSGKHKNQNQNRYLKLLIPIRLEDIIAKASADNYVQSTDAPDATNAPDLRTLLNNADLINNCSRFYQYTMVHQCEKILSECYQLDSYQSDKNRSAPIHRMPECL